MIGTDILEYPIFKTEFFNIVFKQEWCKATLGIDNPIFRRLTTKKQWENFNESKWIQLDLEQSEILESWFKQQNI